MTSRLTPVRGLAWVAASSAVLVLALLCVPRASAAGLAVQVAGVDVSVQAGDPSAPVAAVALPPAPDVTAPVGVRVDTPVGSVAVRTPRVVAPRTPLPAPPSPARATPADAAAPAATAAVAPQAAPMAHLARPAAT
ncbi:MAG TPA: hypothetical protein VL422_05210, partial [Miltoncostaea sp.]|nr:hypothetical protein [Miltoncostaea sp.]